MERIGTLVVAPTTERKAEPGRFATALRSATADAVSGIAGSLTLAAPFVPGGAVLAGALRSSITSGVAPGGVPTGPGASTGPATGGTGAPGFAPLAAAAPSPAPVPPGAAGVLPGGTGSDLMEATRVLQQQAQTFNLQYLQLQESMQRESREFTSLSNVMKVRHESAKAAINNIH